LIGPIRIGITTHGSLTLLNAKAIVPSQGHKTLAENSETNHKS